MSDIFISYKREEQSKARQLATALERQGWSVWWDPKLRAGEYFDEVIEKALDEARCVIVLWSSSSVQSRYVKDEATYALDHGKLAPVAIEHIRLPLRFRGIQTPQLIDWDGDESSEDFNNLLEDIEAILDTSPAKGQLIREQQVRSQGEDGLKRQAEETSERLGNSAVDKNKHSAGAIQSKAESGLEDKDGDVVATQKPDSEPITTDTRQQPQQKETTAKPNHSLRRLVIAAVVAVGVIIWLQIPTATDPDQSTDPERQAEINALLQEADRVIEEGSFEAANEVLSRVIQINPKHPAIEKLKQEIAELAEQQRTERQAAINTLIQQAEQAVGEGAFESVKKTLTKLAQLDPDNPHISELERRLDAAKQRKQLDESQARKREEEILHLLERGRAAEDALHLTTPDHDNAVDRYRAVLGLDPENSAAKAGLARVVQRYLDWARRALAAGRTSDVELNLNKAVSVDPDHPGIRQLLEEKAEWQKQQASIDVGEMVRIKPGCFEMGSPDSEEERDTDERQHQVCIKQAFLLGRNEVTVAQFSRFVEATGYRTDAEKNTGGEEGCWAYDADDKANPWAYRGWASWRKPNKYQANRDDHPVACVSWNDASAYISWLNEQPGMAYRLPTEAEWEYAARAGRTISRFWSDGVDDQACRYANVADEGHNWSNSFPCNDGYEWSSPVGKYQANNWGLNDMLGNILEWTCSGYDEEYGGSENVCTGQNDSGRRVLRGGSWGSRPWKVRSANRDGDFPGGRVDDLGFRLAQDP